MYGTPNRNTGGGTGDLSARSPSDPAAGPRAPAPGSASGSLAAERRLSDFDMLGQTLVATPVVATLSGTDAINLSAELLSRIYGSGGKPDAERASSVRHVVLDLANVRYMDSMCVGVLVELLTKLTEAGGRIALVNADPNVEYLFKLTRLDRVFPICRDVMKAIEVVERAG